jgi:hypothetical protein
VCQAGHDLTHESSIYNGVGVVKRHVNLVGRERPVLSPRIFFARPTKTRSFDPSVDSGSTSHLFGHFNSDHDLFFGLPRAIGGGKTPNQDRDGLASTIELPGLSCRLTRCACGSGVRNIQYILTASFRAMATFAMRAPRRNFNRT